MIRENRVSLWLGFFQSKQEFMSYIEVAYDEDDNFIPSKFQNDYAIDEYDLDAIESDWISERCSDVKSLLAGFSEDKIIIPQFNKLLKNEKIETYNSIVLLYNYDYEIIFCNNKKLKYIGCVNVFY